MSLIKALLGALALLPAYFFPSESTDWYKIPITTIVIANVLSVLVTWLLCFILRRHITQVSSKHREFVISSVKRDREASEKEERLSSGPEDADWEKVQGSEKAVSDREASKDNTYDGLIGFFHPFA